MRIALVTTDGREVLRDYAARAPGFGTAPEALMQGFARTPEAEVHVLSCIQRPVVSPEKLAENIWFHSLVVPKLGWLRTGYQGCIRAVRRKLRQLAPDIVHGQGTERECAVSAVFSGFPNVLTVHGNMRLIAKVKGAPPFSYLWLAAQLERWTLPRSGGVICLTQHTQRAVQPLARRTWVLPNAVEQAFFDVPRAPVSPPLILCAASIDPLKNQRRLMEALDSLAERSSFRLRFCGSVSEHTAYGAEFLKQVAARPWCEFSGSLTRAALRQALSQASLLALPSLEENCPMTVLEAMAAAVPVAAANVGGVPELIEDGCSGLLFDPANPGSIAQAVQRLLDDVPLRARLSRQAKERAVQHFHPLQIARRHMEIYRAFLSSGSSPEGCNGIDPDTRAS